MVREGLIRECYDQDFVVSQRWFSLECLIDTSLTEEVEITLALGQSYILWLVQEVSA